VFELDSRAGELRKHGVKIRLQEKPLRILELLLQDPGQPVTREELRARLWPSNVFVDFDHNLNSAVNKLRDALGDSASSPRFVETLPRGYRFIAPVSVPVAVPAAPELSVEPSALPAEPEVTPLPPPPVLAPRRRLRWALAGLTAVSMLAVAVSLFTLGLGARPADGIGVVVLPFQNLSADPDQEFFSDGFTDEMIAQVGKLDPSRLHVIARTSAMRYKRTDKTIDQIGGELGVEYILDGSVLLAAPRVRITAQLVRVRDRAHVWSQSYERDLRDVIALQAEVARAIAEEIEVAFERTKDAAAEARRNVAPEVYEAYLKGRYFLDKSPSPDGLRKSIESFEHAIAREPSFGPAHAGLADAYGVLGWGMLSDTPPSEAYPKARAAALRALQLDDGLAAGHVALARILWKYEWNWRDAEAAFKRALELEPSSAQAHESYFDFLSALGRNDEAFVQLKRAAALDPLSLTVHYDFGLHFARTGDYDQAIVRMKKAIDLEPTSGFVRHVMGEFYADRGRFGEAQAELERAIALSGEVPHFVVALAHVRAQAGDRQAAIRALERLESLATKTYVAPVEMALAHMALGNKARAIDFLEQAHRDRDPWLSIVRVQTRLNGLSGEPRFQALLRRIGLGERVTATN
jgi:TolB-like protein/DNA-binding winged helix-turn-helix (wHTH) protein/Tfp pilus assembly protein PilF